MARKPKPPAREKTVQVGLRLPLSLVERIDRHAERLRRETGLLGVTRTDAATALLVQALGALEQREGGPKRPRRPR
jgi:hypothetical protein